MKMKRVFAALCVALMTLAMAATKAHAQTPGDFLSYRQHMTIVVDCMDNALARMGTMPGFELSSQIYVVEGRGQATRMVANTELNAALAQLRSLGHVVDSQSQAQNQFATWAWLSAELQVRNREYDRLVALLYDATGMAQFNQIERRLQQVIVDLEHIQRLLNSVTHEMGSAQIVITFTQHVSETIIDPVPEYEPAPPPGRLRYIANAFIGAAGDTAWALQAVVVFLTHISLPLVGLLAMGLGLFKIIQKRRNAWMQTAEMMEGKK
jgi:hypothetical protein